VLEKKVADEVKVGEILGFIHANDEAKAVQAASDLRNAYTIVNHKVERPKYILGVI